jgi:hypothetical protein
VEVLLVIGYQEVGGGDIYIHWLPREIYEYNNIGMQHKDKNLKPSLRIKYVSE